VEKKKNEMARPAKFTAAFKAKVAVEALRETVPLETLAQKYGVAPSKITEWKTELLNNADKVFGIVSFHLHKILDSVSKKQ
jgi:transposase-like protein